MGIPPSPFARIPLAPADSLKKQFSMLHFNVSLQFFDVRKYLARYLSAFILIFLANPSAASRLTISKEFQIIKPYDWLYSASAAFFESYRCSTPVNFSDGSSILRSDLRSLVMKCISQNNIPYSGDFSLIYQDLVIEESFFAGSESFSGDVSSSSVHVGDEPSSASLSVSGSDDVSFEEVNSLGEVEGLDGQFDVSSPDGNLANTNPEGNPSLLNGGQPFQPAPELSAPEPLNGGGVANPAVIEVGDLQAMREERFQSFLDEMDLAAAEQACLDTRIANSDRRRQALRDRLLALHPVIDSLELVLANAESLMNCAAPEAAAVVLNRYSPRVGDERRQWLLLRWRAAIAALDHRQAALTLRRLVDGDLRALDSPLFLDKPLQDQINGLDQLALHEAALGRNNVAAEVQLQGDLTGLQGAKRMARSAHWMGADQFERADHLLETALDQAAAAEAWGLAMDFLRQQLQLQHAAGGDGERPLQRLKRLASVLNDRYVLQQLQPEAEPDPLLRSPRDPGGHADVRPSNLSPSP